MPHVELIWIDGPDGNVQHLPEHGVTREEVRDVLTNPISTAVSRRTGRPIAFGFTRTGRKLAVIYERVDRMTVYPVTAFDAKD
jgi:uncharacterized DUF497 family protein